MAQRNRPFSEKTRSKLHELYDSFDSIISKNVAIRLTEGGEPVTYNDIQMAMKTHPFVMTKNKNERLELDSITYNDVNTIISAMKSLPNSPNCVTIEMVQIEKFPNVFYVPSKRDVIEGLEYVSSPRMTIELSKENILPNQGVRVNTGYSIRIPLDSQIDVVIIPTIVSNHPGLIPALYARDPDDTGLLTINFTTTSSVDLSVEIEVEFEAYHSIPPPIPKYDESKWLKPKDCTPDRFPGRFVKNTKLKFYANDFDTTTMEGTLLLRTFNHKKRPIVPNKQKISLKGAITLFTSRKREWSDPALVTLSGIYNPSTSSNTVTPMVAKGSEFYDNTHCLSFINSRVLLFSITGSMGTDICMINGSFVNLKDYSIISKTMRHLQESLRALSEGAKEIRLFNTRNGPLDEMKSIRVYDYYRDYIDINDSKFAEMVNYDEERLLQDPLPDLHPHSVKIYQSLKYLAEIFCTGSSPSLLPSTSTST